MSVCYDTYNSTFGLLTIGKGPENDFVWTGNTDGSTTIFSELIPVYIFTKDRRIPSNTINLAETIILNLDLYIEKSLLFIKKTLNEQREKYKIREDEYPLLALDINDFPVDIPELIFWEGSNEWMIRFAGGKFYICDPFGISVTFNLTNPISVDNIEDSEYIGE
jgi:hypothetical protein